jgi:hypothetical protein
VGAGTFIDVAAAESGNLQSTRIGAFILRFLPRRCKIGAVDPQHGAPPWRDSVLR